MTFNIGSQNAGQINNVAGDMYVSGGQHGVAGTPEAARQISRTLRRSVATLPLEGRDAEAARSAVDEIDAGLEREQPDRSRIAGALVEPLQALAGWLGDLGAPVLQLLG
jgi:hypothetical protein